MAFSEVQSQRCKQLFEQLFSELTVPAFDCLYACQWFFAEMAHARQDALYLERTVGKRDFLDFVLQDWHLAALCHQAYERSGGIAVAPPAPPAVSSPPAATAPPAAPATREPPPPPAPRATRPPPPPPAPRVPTRPPPGVAAATVPDAPPAVASATFRLCPLGASESWGITVKAVGETQEVVKIVEEGEVHRQLGTSLLHWRILSANGQTGAGIPAELKKKSLAVTLEAVYAGPGERQEEGEEHAENAERTSAEAEAAAAPPARSPDGEWGSVTLARGEFGAIESNLVFHGAMAHEPQELESVFLDNFDYWKGLQWLEFAKHLHVMKVCWLRNGWAVPWPLLRDCVEAAKEKTPCAALPVSVQELEDGLGFSDWHFRAVGRVEPFPCVACGETGRATRPPPQDSHYGPRAPFKKRWCAMCFDREFPEFPEEQKAADAEEERVTEDCEDAGAAAPATVGYCFLDGQERYVGPEDTPTSPTERQWVCETCIGAGRMDGEAPPLFKLSRATCPCCHRGPHGPEEVQS